jgi:hypothetical protein
LTENTRLTAEIYEKEYDNLPLDPSQPSLFILDQPIYQIMRFTPHERLESRGKAYARGVEVSVQKKLAEKLYGLASGTVFRSRYRDLDRVWRNRVNDNQYAFNIDGGFKPNHKWEFSLRWTYAGGIPYTPFDFDASQELGRGVFDSTRVNSERLPDYHSLSVRFDRRFHFSGSNLTLYVSVWNVLNVQNTWYHLWNEVTNQPNTIEQLERTPIFGLEFEF